MGVFSWSPGPNQPYFSKLAACISFLLSSDKGTYMTLHKRMHIGTCTYTGPHIRPCPPHRAGSARSFVFFGKGVGCAWRSHHQGIQPYKTLHIRIDINVYDAAYTILIRIRAHIYDLPRASGWLRANLRILPGWRRICVATTSLRSNHLGRTHSP